MADDKPTLTRRRVLGSMATVGAAGAVGATTWSRFTDEETKQVTATAGTLDLRVKHDGTWYNETTVGVEGDPLENGGTFTDCEQLQNNGNITADSLVVGLSNIKDYENGLQPPEEGNGGSGPNSGELSKYLMISGTLECDGSEYPCMPGQDSTNGYVRLNDATEGTIGVDGVEINPGDTCELCFTVKLIEDGEEKNANDAMSDQTQFDIDLRLEQNPGTSQPE